MGFLELPSSVAAAPLLAPAAPVTHASANCNLTSELSTKQVQAKDNPTRSCIVTIAQSEEVYQKQLCTVHSVYDNACLLRLIWCANGMMIIDAGPTSKHPVQTAALRCRGFMTCLACKGSKCVRCCIAGACAALSSLCCTSLQTTTTRSRNAIAQQQAQHDHNTEQMAYDEVRTFDRVCSKSQEWHETGHLKCLNEC